MKNFISLKNVYKNYDKRVILEDFSFDLPEGKFITLIGCNGAGKSTTLRLLAGDEPITKGELTVFEKDPYSYSYPFRKDVFLIHENYEIHLHHTMLEMIKIYRETFPRWSNKIFNQMAKDRKISLKKKFSELSRGQKMQFLLMMALASRPKVLLLDEITSVIDIDGQRYFLDLLKQFTVDGGTVVITTNILSELNEYTDHLVLLQDTKLKLNNSVAQIQEDFVILEKLKDHEIFANTKISKIRSSGYDVKEIYLVPVILYQKYSDLEDCLTSYKPKLEDILIFHFKFKENTHEDELVA